MTNCITKVDPSTQKALDTIRDVAEASARIRDLVRAVRQSGAFGVICCASPATNNGIALDLVV
jgi:hypothetical protein